MHSWIEQSMSMIIRWCMVGVSALLVLVGGFVCLMTAFGQTLDISRLLVGYGIVFVGLRILEKVYAKQSRDFLTIKKWPKI